MTSSSSSIFNHSPRICLTGYCTSRSFSLTVWAVFLNLASSFAWLRPSLAYAFFAQLESLTLCHLGDNPIPFLFSALGFEQHPILIEVNWFFKWFFISRVLKVISLKWVVFDGDLVHRHLDPVSGERYEPSIDQILYYSFYDEAVF